MRTNRILFAVLLVVLPWILAVWAASGTGTGTNPGNGDTLVLGVQKRPETRVAYTSPVLRSASKASSTPCAQGIAKDQVLVALKVATAVATAAPSNSKKLVGGILRF